MPKATGETIKAIAAVLSNDSSSVGTAFLLTPRYVLSCAHVVERALGVESQESLLAPSQSHQPDDASCLGKTVILHFAALGLQVKAQVVSHHTLTGTGERLRDICVLALEKPLETTPLSLSLNEDYWNKHVRIFGFPAARPFGSHAEADLKEVVANGWVLLRGGADAREFVRPGFSGAPVFDDEGQVLGILSAGTQVQREALMIPAKHLLEAYPALAKDLPDPYPGLRPFESFEKRFFFGRKEEFKHLVQVLHTSQSALLTGSSGSGKSSLLKAGLIPHYKEQAYLTLYFYGKNSFLEDFSSMLVEAWLAAGPSQLLEAKRLKEALESRSLDFKDVVPKVLADTSYKGIFFIFDQLEEWLNQDNARHILDLLNLTGPEIHCLISVRADFLETFLNTCAQKLELIYLRPIPNLRELIEEPLRELGMGKLESGLTDRIIEDLEDEVNPLPLLQFCLHELWHKRVDYLLSHVSYNALGGVKEAIGSYAEICYQRYSEPDQVILKSLLLQLIQPNLERPTKRIAYRAEFPLEQQKIIDTLANQRLVHLQQEGRLELSHEALINHWPRLAAWYEGSKAFRVFQEKLRTQLKDYHVHRHPDYLLKEKQVLEAESFLDDFLANEEREFIRLSQEHANSLKSKEVAEAKRKLKLQRRLSQNFALLFVISFLAAVGGLYLFWQGRSQTTLAVKAQTLAEEQARQAMVAQLSAQALLANQNLKDSENGRQLAFAAHELNLPSLGNNLQIARHSLQEFELSSDSLAFQIQGKIVKVLGKDGKILSYDLKAGKLLAELQLDIPNQSTTLRAMGPSLLSAAFTPDGKVLLGMSDGSLWTLDGSGEKRSDTWLQDEGIYRMVLSSDGKTLVSTGSGDGSSLRFWNVPDLKLKAEIKRPHYRRTDLLSFSPDAELLVTGSIDSSLNLWNTKTFKLMHSFTPYQLEMGLTLPDIQGIPIDPFKRALWVTAIAISPDKKLVARGGWDGSVILIDLESLKKSEIQVPKQPNTVTALAFSPDAQSLRVGSRSGTLRDYHLDGSETVYFQGSVKAIDALSSIDESQFLSLSQTKLNNWEITQSIKPDLLLSGSRGAGGLALSPDGETLAIASSDRSLYLYNLKEKSLIASLSDVDLVWANLAFSPDGSKLVSSDCCRFTFWDLSSLKPITQIFETKTAIDSFGYEENDLIILNHREGSDVFDLANKNLDLGAMSYFEQDGKHYIQVLDGYRDDKNRFFPVKTQERFVYSPLTDLYFISDFDELYFWNAETQQETKRIKAHNSIIAELVLSKNKHLAASSGDDRRIILWDLLTGEQASEPLIAHTETVKALLFHPTMPLLFSGSEDGRVIMWHLTQELWEK